VFEATLGYRKLCEGYGASRTGALSVTVGVFHRLRVSPDGSAVVFEMTDDHTLLPEVSEGVLPAEQEGIFFVRSDGTGLRRLGPASREPSFFGAGERVWALYEPRFSPDGRRIIYTDHGPGPGGVEATQVFSLEVEGGKPARQVTRLPTGLPVDGEGGSRSVQPPFFVDSETIVFATRANVDGKNPEGIVVVVTMRIDGTGLRVFPAPAPSAAGAAVPIFTVTGGRAIAAQVALPGPAVNSSQPAPINEIVLVNGTRLLQLTNFRRFDTFSPFMRPGGPRAFFSASADPFGTNPSEECQLFSISRLGTRLRQLTFFHTVGRAANGCLPIAESPECGVGGISPNAQDPRSGTLVFPSTCDPFGTNPNGEQIFALRPDGSGFRQLTHTRGLLRSPSGTVETELPGPASYSGGQVP
jgi:hypothetical protein